MNYKKIPAEEIKTAGPEQLIRAFKPWLHSMTNKFKGYLQRSGVLDDEDLFWAGAEALLKAQATWDPALGEFLTHAFYDVRSAMQRQLSFGHHKIEPENVYLDAPLTEDEERTLHDVIPSDAESPEDIILKDDYKDQIQAALSRLGDPVAETILKKRYYDQKTAKDVAAEMKLDPLEIRSYTERAFRRLRHDRYLRNLSNFIRHVGVNEFNRTRTSEVEAAVLYRERAYSQLYGPGWVEKVQAIK